MDDILQDDQINNFVENIFSNNQLIKNRIYIHFNNYQTYFDIIQNKRLE